MTAGLSAVVVLISALTVSSAESLRFFHVSDVHLDPFYNKAADVKTYCQGSGSTADYEAPFGRIGCDSPLALWKVALSRMKQKGQKGRGAEFMMLSGDSSAHGLTDDHSSPKVLKAMAVVASEAQKVFPDIPIFPAIGNIDLPGHYILPNNSNWYKTVLSHFVLRLSQERGKTYNNRGIDENVLEGGYSKVNIAGGKIILLVLNTMYWNNNRYTNDLVEQVAETQMLWLKDQLQVAKDQRKRVLIMSHIPPGGDPFDDSYFWYRQYITSYASLTAGQFHDIVAEFAHPVWKSDSSFSRKYPSKNKLIDADRIDELNRKLISQTEGRYWNEYMPSTTSHYQLGSYDRFALYCVMRYVFEEDFEKCLEKFKVPGG